MQSKLKEINDFEGIKNELRILKMTKFDEGQESMALDEILMSRNNQLNSEITLLKEQGTTHYSIESK